MLRTYLATAAIALLNSISLAQGDLKPRLHPIVSQPKHLGIYHVATGRWTRNSHLANLTGPDTIYNNTCFSGYFAALMGDEHFQHRSRVPSTTGPFVPSTFYGSPRYDEVPGCADSYVVNGWTFAYCSSRVGTFDYDQEFANSYALCGGGDMVPDVGKSFVIPGLPGGTVTGGQNCWVVDVDLTAGSTDLSFTLLADGDGAWQGPPPGFGDQFGWSMGGNGILFTDCTGGDCTGPVIAGNYTWTGGPSVGPFTPCTGTDGSIWDCPVNLGEEGTGMTSLDAIRLTGMATSNYPGCHFFGGTIHADFYLKLYADTGGCVGPCAPGTPFCVSGQDLPSGSCPCGNEPAGDGLGCDNFGSCACDPKSGTLQTSGLAEVGGGDVLSLDVTGMNSSSLTVFFTGTAQSSPVVQGAGLRCVGGQLKRLYSGNGSGGAISRPSGADPSVSDRSAELNATITPGETRYYFNVYRDPMAAAACGFPSSTINTTNAQAVLWL